MNDNPINDPAVLAALKAHFITNKGLIAHRQKKPAYYSEPYGLRVKEIIDSIMATKKSVKILATEGASLYTLRQQFYEGSRYLRTMLDPHDTYKRIMPSIKCATCYDYIEISPRFTMRDALLKAPTAIVVNWKEEMTEWLNSTPALDSKYTSTALLSPEDIQWCNEQLEGVEKLFLAEFKQTGIIIVRYNHE